MENNFIKLKYRNTWQGRVFIDTFNKKAVIFFVKKFI